eukprot:GHUV01007093.1.p1 GENE.GHUV01007093.1~~GHUV01007093.1.p1  ORF type:complete len:186 (+),score=29.25 GHUV01007093.1:1121-1678(+)
MAGLASIQYMCQDSETPNVGTTTGTTGSTTAVAPVTSMGVFGLSDSAANCRRMYRFYWFTFAFVLVTLLGLLVTSFMLGGLMTSRPFWVGMLAISTVLMMIASETFLAFTDFSEANSFGQWPNRIRTTTVGAIMSVAFLIFLMMAVGTDWRTDETATGTTRTGVVDKPMSGVGPGVGPGTGVAAV